MFSRQAVLLGLYRRDEKRGLNMDIAHVVALIGIIGISILPLFIWLFWSFFILPRLEKKWARESAEEFEQDWDRFMRKK